ncbi:MAG: hypothetical protein WAV25_01395 [Minisyncoccia bacterium]
MSIPNTSNEIKPLAPETVSYVGEGEIVDKSYLSRFFWITAVILVIGLLFGIKNLMNIQKPNVTIEMPPK